MKSFVFAIILLTVNYSFISCNTALKENSEKGNVVVKNVINKKEGVLIEVSAEGLLKMLKYDKNAFVIDVRKANNNIRSCKLIEGYKHIEDSLIYKNPDILPKKKSIVLLSKTGERSRKLGTFLKNKGMTVYNLKGGMDSYWKWRAQIIRDSLHIYDEQINVIELYADDFGC
jgi:rhodanese-related sulfurtransferase